ncbi:MAG: PAS domain S-box protein [Candidatus Aminicenantes bacterium]|nr:PAS domain S-box protein [Candidatus Aminicenantes bacterium]
MKPIEITDQKNKAFDLKNAIELPYQALMDVSPDAIVISDQNGIILMMNKKLADLHGYESNQELIGKCAFDLFVPEERQRAADHMSKAMKAEPGDSRKFEGILQRKDGTRFWGELYGKFLLLPDVKLPLMLTVVRDITERTLAEKALKESKERYENFIYQISDGVYRAEFDEPLPLTLSIEEQIDYYDKHLFLAECNPSFMAMYGIKEVNDVIGKPLKETFIRTNNTWDLAARRHYIESKYQAKNLITKEVDFYGNVKYFNNNIIGVIENDHVIRLWGTQTDITERKAAEESIQASLQEKEVMLREIHHRVKNNMQVISSLFRLQARKNINSEYLEILKEGQTRIRAMSLVHEKLYQSRDLSKIDLAVYIQSLAVHLFTVYLTDPDQVQLETDLEEVPLDINSAVPCGLILNELISNSLKHAFPEGRKGLIRIGLKRGPDDTIILRVADDGIGFPKDIDFLQFESLGLQIAKLLVGQLEGTIDLDRTNGTTFTVTFRELKYAPRIQ